MLSAYIIFVVFLLFIILGLVYKLYQFGMLLLELEDVIEDCLDQIDERYQSIGKILQKEIFFDSVEVRQVIADIKATHFAMLSVANKLTTLSRAKSETKEKNNKAS